MAVVRRTIKGQRFWVIDRRFKRIDGTEERYRRVAKVQNRAAAEAEERRLIETWELHGTLKPTPSPRATSTPKKASGKTWDDAVKHYRDVIAPTKKPSTRVSYAQVIEGAHMIHWQGLPLEDITRVEIEKWAAALATEGLSASSQRNHHVVLRSVVKSVVGLMLDEAPTFPPLPKVGRTAIEAPDPDDVEKLLNEKDDPKQPKLLMVLGKRGIPVKGAS